MGAQVVLPVCLYSPGSAKNVACGVSVVKPALTHICFKRLMEMACIILSCPTFAQAVVSSGVSPVSKSRE